MKEHERKTILLVEDDVILAMAEAQTIQRFRYEVITANSGEEAVRLASGNKRTNLPS